MFRNTTKAKAGATDPGSVFRGCRRARDSRLSSALPSISSDRRAAKGRGAYRNQRCAVGRLCAKMRSARQEREGDKPGRAPVTLKQSIMVLI